MGTTETTAFITIPDGRGVFRADTIETTAIHTPRLPFHDEATGKKYPVVLIIETARCVHRFPFDTHADAAAVIKSIEDALILLRSGHQVAPGEADAAAIRGCDPGFALPPLPTSRRFGGGRIVSNPIKQLQETSYVRIEKLIWLAGLTGTSAMTDDLEEFVSDVGYACARETMPGALLQAFDRADADDLDDGELAEEILVDCTHHGIAGFLFKVAVPVTSNHGPNSFTYSWGHYLTKWAYAETLDGVAAYAIAFADKAIADEKARTLSKPEATTPESGQESSQ